MRERGAQTLVENFLMIGGGKSKREQQYYRGTSLMNYEGCTERRKVFGGNSPLSILEVTPLRNVES